MAENDLNKNIFLKNRLQFHAASRVGIQTGQALAQATNADGHIVTTGKVWSASADQFVKHTAEDMKTTSDGIAANKDLVAVFKDGAHEYGSDLTNFPDETKTLSENLVGKVFRNPAFPAVELYEGVTMTGVAGSNAKGSGATAQYQAYEILNDTSRIMDYIPPTSVSDNGLPVPGYTCRVEGYKNDKWTDLEECGDVGGGWALAEGNWETIYPAGMVIFHPDFTPIGKEYTKIRFTGFKYIGETLDKGITNIGTKLTGINTNIEGVQGDINTINTNITNIVNDLEWMSDEE